MMCKKKMFMVFGMFTIQIRGLGFQDVDIQSLGFRNLMMGKKKKKKKEGADDDKFGQESCIWDWLL